MSETTTEEPRTVLFRVPIAREGWGERQLLDMAESRARERALTELRQHPEITWRQIIGGLRWMTQRHVKPPTGHVFLDETGIQLEPWVRGTQPPEDAVMLICEVRITLRPEQPEPARISTPASIQLQPSDGAAS
jgi:hypothetical protein